MHQAGIIRAAVAAWTPMAVPQLEQAKQILAWAAAQSEEGHAPLFVDSKTTEGARLTRALAAALGNLARASGALSAVLAALEESRFKDCFDVDRLLRIGEAAGRTCSEFGEHPVDSAGKTVPSAGGGLPPFLLRHEPRDTCPLAPDLSPSRGPFFRFEPLSGSPWP